MRIYLATWLLEISQGESLTRVGANSRLLSYFHTKDKESEFPEYCKTGRNKKDENLSGRQRSDAKRTKRRVI